MWTVYGLKIYIYIQNTKKKLTFKYFDILNERDEHTKQDVKRDETNKRGKKNQHEKK